MEEERFKFVIEVQKNERSFKEICEEFGVSRPTGYKWWQRYNDVRDPEVLKDQSRAPNTVVRKTDYEMESLICGSRKKHLSWGPEKILARLKMDFPRRKIWPSISTAGRILKRNEMIKPKRRRVKTPPYTKPFAEVTAANQLWCIDFKGHFKTKDGTKIYPLTITDAFSRYILCCEALRSPDLFGVGHVMVKVFKKYGLPEAIRSDNGTPFASTGVGGLTKLSVWWVKMGIKHERIEPGKPQQNGRHERMHRTLKDETCKNPATTFFGQKIKFRKFVNEFNDIRPHQALENKTPSEIYVPSMKAYNRDAEERGLPKFGLDYAFVNRHGLVEFNSHKFKLGTSLSNEFVDVYPNGKSRWIFAYGPVLLGEYLDKKKKFLRAINKKSVNHVVT
jgi:transposase InsO family protein